MDDLEQIGKRRTILISISILLVSLHTIYFYHSVRPDSGMGKFIQQAIRFLLTCGLLIMVYKGKNWARITALILFSIAAIGAVFGIVTNDLHSINKIPLFVMLFVYSLSLYHFGLLKSFKAFFKFQRERAEIKEKA